MAIPIGYSSTEGGANFTSGNYSATSSFALHSNNYNASGIEVYEDTMWVTDASSDKVFVYSTDGSYLGNWGLDSANGSSSGITTDSTGQHLWVTDKNDGVVYYYEHAAALRSGSASATSLIHLPENNDRPEGIADPVMPINYGDTVTDNVAIANELDDWQFTGTTGERIYIDFLSASGNVTRQLIAPDGSIVADRTTSNVGLLSLEQTLDQTGTYTVRITGGFGATPNYSFALYEASASDETLSFMFDEVVSGAINGLGGRDFYEINVTAGQMGFLDFQANVGEGYRSSLSILRAPMS